MTDTLTKIGGYQSGIGAEIVAHDPERQLLFVVSGRTTLEVLSISDPTSPTQVAAIDIAAAFNAPVGGANSVAFKNGILAVAFQAEEKTDPGVVALVDLDSFLANPADPAALKVVGVGALPDMVTFSPDGTQVLVANEGEPNDDYSIDPEGSVSLIDLADGVAAATVRTADFKGFNDQADVLQAAGVRIFGPGATVAQDLEPEYIAVSGDAKTAYVTLQENNALAVVNLETATVAAIVPLGFKDYEAVQVTDLQTYQLADLPVLGTTAAGQEVLLGGFSGLFFEGYTDSGNLKFVTHTDRGPNGEPTGSLRPFLLPDFAPEILRLELNPGTGALAITQRIQLQKAPGELLTGLPNTAIANGTANSAYNDEIPVDLQGNVLPLDPLGADLEGIVVAEDGSFWMVDEYRPALYHFDPSGVLIDRFVPLGTAAAAGAAAGTFGTEVLPAELAQRRQNRGFEAVAYQDGKLYAFVQSPIRNPETVGNAALNGQRNVRVVEFDPTTQTTRQFLYRMDNPDLGTPGNSRADKIGDAVAIGGGQFLVVERDDDAIDSDAPAQIEKKVYRFDLSGATDISGLAGPIDLGNGVAKTVDQMTAAELALAGVVPLEKTLHVDLNAAGYNQVEKVEGLALIDANTLAVINDNDFGVAGIVIDNATGTFIPDPNAEPILLGLITTESNPLDASDRDGGITIRNWPVLGMYLPDAIAAYSYQGQTYLVTANEGDARDYEGFGEEDRVKDLVLDPTAFPNAAALQQNENLGRLTVTNTLGDTDGDGDFDQLYAYGARSFSIWDSQGNLVFDSGADLERIIAEQVPDLFNAEGTAAGFDSRSDNKGPEPEGLTLGQVGDKTYAFIGLERVGGVMVYDVTNPTTPAFVQYVPNAPGDASPEGLAFIAGGDSPTERPLLLLAHEVSNTLAVYDFSAGEGVGSNGSDTLLGGTTHDLFFALGAADLVAGNLGDDTLYGGDGDDVLRGDRNLRSGQTGEPGGADVIYGGAGNDRIGGKSGDDRLFGDGGDDQIWGDDGDDWIRGGLGNDTLTGDNNSGGRGSDIFVLASGEGTDTITDFEVGVDLIGLANGLSFGSLIRTGNGLEAGGEILATLSGVDVAALTASSFLTI